MSSRLLSTVGACVLALALIAPAANARAQEYYEPEPEKPHTLTVSISPLHLILPIVELQAELRVIDHLGVSLIGGYGRLTAKSSTDDVLHFSALELGGQLVWYPKEIFEGLHLGAEAMWLEATLDEPLGTTRYSGVGAGFSVGPLIGYKWIHESGFSVFVQGGFTVLLSRAHVKNDLGQEATAKENEILVLLNVNLGWTF